MGRLVECGKTRVLVGGSVVGGGGDAFHVVELLQPTRLPRLSRGDPAPGLRCLHRRSAPALWRGLLIEAVFVKHVRPRVAAPRCAVSRRIALHSAAERCMPRARHCGNLALLLMVVSSCPRTRLRGLQARKGADTIGQSSLWR